VDWIVPRIVERKAARFRAVRVNAHATARKCASQQGSCTKKAVSVWFRSVSVVFRLRCSVSYRLSIASGIHWSWLILCRRLSYVLRCCDGVLHSSANSCASNHWSCHSGSVLCVVWRFVEHSCNLLVGCASNHSVMALRTLSSASTGSVNIRACVSQICPVVANAVHQQMLSSTFWSISGCSLHTVHGCGFISGSSTWLLFSQEKRRFYPRGGVLDHVYMILSISWLCLSV